MPQAGIAGRTMQRAHWLRPSPHHPTLESGGGIRLTNRAGGEWQGNNPCAAEG